MTDVSSWSPLDGDNNLPPPDGWPEFMMPSGVNNCGRMMMGAVRRMYDKQVSGEIVLPYLKLAGAPQTVTSAVTFSAGIIASGITSNGVINAASTISTTGAIAASGNVSGGSFSTGGAISGGNITAAGEINAAGRVNAGGALDIGGSHVAARLSGGMYYHDNAGAIGLVLYGDGNAGLNNNTLNFNDRGGGLNATISSGGFVVSRGGIAINSGGLTVSGVANIGNGLNVTGNAGVTGTATTGHVVTTNVTAYGNLAVSGSANVGSVVTTHDVMPSVDNAGLCGGAAAAWNTVMSYTYITASDAALKTDISPLPDTLPLVAALVPKAFVYEGDDARRHWGFVAQDVRDVVSNYPVDLVTGDEGRLGLDYGGLTAMLWKAVQELSARLTALEAGGL